MVASDRPVGQVLYLAEYGLRQQALPEAERAPPREPSREPDEAYGEPSGREDIEEGDGTHVEL